MREGLRRYPFVKRNETKDIAESPTRRGTPKIYNAELISQSRKVAKFCFTQIRQIFKILLICGIKNKVLASSWLCGKKHNNVTKQKRLNTIQNDR